MDTVTRIFSPGFADVANNTVGLNKSRVMEENPQGKPNLEALSDLCDCFANSRFHCHCHSAYQILLPPCMGQGPNGHKKSQNMISAVTVTVESGIGKTVT